MRRRLVFSAIAGLGVAFMASVIAYLTSRELLTYPDESATFVAHQSLVEALNGHRAATGQYAERLSNLTLPERAAVLGYCTFTDA